MNEDEEDGILIADGQREETFTIKDANDAVMVQSRFQLDSTPQNVLNNKANPVKFGNLKDGRCYKLPKSETLIPNQKVHTRNSVILSQAVYKALEEDEKNQSPKTFLNANTKNHTVHTICDITKHSKQQVILAVGQVAEANVLYVAYRGTCSKDDVLADMNIKLKERESFQKGKFHAGFEDRSQTVPVEYILQCADEKQCKTIVTCGHSMGGAVSTIVALDLLKNMEEDEENERLQVYNITFGAPFFGNQVTGKVCKDLGFEQKIVNFVSCKDIVPGILSLEHTTSVIRKHNIQLTESVFESAIKKYPESTARVISNFLERDPFIKTKFDLTENDVAIIKNLSSDVIKGFEKTDLGLEFTDEMFVPIGSYIVLENGLFSTLNADDVTRQLRELTLKQPITKIETISEILEGHSIAKYAESLTSVDLCPEPRTVEQESFFTPRITIENEAPIDIVWAKENDTSWNLQLVAIGRFLKSPQISSECNYFRGLPFSYAKIIPNGMNEIIHLSGNLDKILDWDQYGNWTLRLASTFGIIEISIDKARELSELNLDNKISITENISTIIELSITRSLVKNTIKSGDKESDKDHLADLVKNDAVKKLKISDQNAYKNLYDSKMPLTKTTEIKEIADLIIKNATKKITITHNKSSKFGYKYFKEVKAKRKSHKTETRQNRNLTKLAQCKPVENWFQQLNAWSADQLNELTMYLGYLWGSEEEIEGEYVDLLESVVSELRMSNILKTDNEKEDLFSELRKGQIEQLNPRAAYLLESILISYCSDREKLETFEIHGMEVWSSLFGFLVNTVKEDEFESFCNEKHGCSEEFFVSLRGFKSCPVLYDQYTQDVKEAVFQNAAKLKKDARCAREKYKGGNGWSYMTTELIREEMKTASTPFAKSKCIFAHIKDPEVVEEKISIFKGLYKIRKLYGKQCYVGFVGPQNAGKSTLINKLYDKKAESGLRTHTTEVTKYYVADDLIALDFPGSNSITNISQFMNSGHLNNFLVFVMRYDGSPDMQMIENVKMAYKIKSFSMKSAQMLFCINKASQGVAGEKFDEDYKTKFVNKIRDHIKKTEYDEKAVSIWKKIKKGTEKKLGSTVYDKIKETNEKLKEYTVNEIKNDDFMFTDWLDKDAHKRGISGPGDVKQRIVDYLVKNDIRKLGETGDFWQQN